MFLAFNFPVKLEFLCSKSTSIFQNYQRILEIPLGHILPRNFSNPFGYIHFIHQFFQFWFGLKSNKTLKNILYLAISFSFSFLKGTIVLSKYYLLKIVILTILKRLHKLWVYNNTINLGLGIYDHLVNLSIHRSVRNYLRRGSVDYK